MIHSRSLEMGEVIKSQRKSIKPKFKKIRTSSGAINLLISQATPYSTAEQTVNQAIRQGATS